jgi:heme exporter protein B
MGPTMSGFLALVARDLQLVWRRPGDVAVVLAFFVVATSLFPLGIGPETNLLARIAAGVLWCAALFASLLSLERLFAADYEDGTLDLLLLAPWPLELAALAKCLSHWIVTGLPLAALAPVLGVAFGHTGSTLLGLSATLLIGTPTLSLIGGLAAALTLGARRGGALLALLALPLCVPTLIFGTTAIEMLATGDDFAAPLLVLAALALVALATTPWAMAAALRQAGE